MITKDIQKNTYTISIITPLHNVDLTMFEKTFYSLKNQTIGFENIEWIIILHNCQKQYWDKINNIVGNCQNTIIKKLNNNKNTASSPRNYGIKLATSKYIGFLDADDSYCLDCLETAYDEITKNNCQIAAFRMEYELYDEIAVPVRDITLWNQCEKRVIVERNNWNNEKMFSGMFGWITSRLFEKKLIVDNNIYFNEDIFLFEDFHFFIRAIAKANRIVYLPQTIGYHYLINGISTIQGKKSGDTLVDQARGLKLLYETFDKYDIPCYFIQISAYIFSESILYSNSVDVEQRQLIKKYIGKYIEKLPKFPSNKILSPERADLFYHLPRIIILDTCNSLQDIYIKRYSDGAFLLSKILRENSETDYGKKYKFDNIKNIDHYTKTMPIMTVKKLQKLICLQTNIAEKEILTKNRPQYYFVNPAGYYTPCSKDHFETYLNTFIHTLGYKKNLLLYRKSDSIKYSNDGSLIGDIESLILIEYFTKKYYTQKQRRASFTSSVGKYFDEYNNKEEYFYTLIKDALMDKNLEQITALTSDSALEAFEILEKNSSKLIDDINIIDSNRAKELKKIFSEGFEKPIAKKIWPKLNKIIAFGAGENYESFHKLKKYIKDIPHNNGYYYTEEAVMGHACRDNCDLFEKSILSQEVFELMSIKDESCSLLSQAIIDEPYQLIITNNCGLYRYETNHFIRIKYKEHAKIYYTIY